MPTGSSGLYPKFRADDADGNPLEGGKLYAFLSGTTTPTALYADPELTTALTQPVVLDASGEALFYTNGQAMKWRLDDANDVPLWTIDPVSGGGGGLGSAGMGVGTSTVALSPSAGVAQASAAVFPPNTLGMALTVWVETSFGTSEGLTHMGVGTASVPDRWGVCRASLGQLTAGYESTAGLFEAYSGQPQPLGAEPITLTAYGGRFDGTGRVYLTGHYMTFRPNHQTGAVYLPGLPGDTLPQDPLPIATELVPGIVELNTPAETITGTDTTRATHAAGLKAALDARLTGTALSVARYASSGVTVEATPGLTTTSDGRLGVVTPPETGVALQVGGTLRVRGAYNVELIGAPDQASSFVTTSFGSQAPPAGAPGMLGTRGRGTEASPASIQADDVMLRVAGRGYQGSSLTSTRVIQELIALETWSATAQGAGMRWLATAIGTVITDEKMRLEGRGNLLIGTTTSGTSLTKGLVLGSGTAPTTSPADAVQLWSADLDGVAGRAGLHLRTEEGILTRIGNGVLARQAVHTLTTFTVASPYSATADDSGKLFVASNSSAMTQVTLPTVVLGLTYSFVIQATQGLRIRAQTGNFLRLGSSTGASGGAIEAAAGASQVGHYLTLTAHTTQHWQVMSAPQTWALIA